MASTLQTDLGSESKRGIVRFSDHEPLLDHHDSPSPPQVESPPLLNAHYARRKSSTARLALERILLTRERLWTTAVSVTIASIPALLLGYTLGYPSSALLDLQALPEEYAFNSVLTDLFGAFAGVGALPGGPIAGWIADRWGRKTALMFSGVPFLIGYFLILCAQSLSSPTGFKAIVLIGRFLTGVGVGWASICVPVYIGEISSTKLRGVFGSATQLSLSAGVVFVFGISSIPEFQYYHTALVAIGIVATFEVFMVWLPESPWWLIAHGKRQQAICVLSWVRGPKVGTKREVEDMEAVISKRKQSTCVMLKEFSKRSVFVPLVLLLVVMFLQQAGGLNAISVYAASIFQVAGARNPRSTAFYAVGVTLIVAAIISVFVVDIAGRKVLLLISGVGMTIGASLLGVHFYITRPSLCVNTTMTENMLADLEDSTACNTQYVPLAIISTILFLASFSFGFGPIPWILMSEFLPLQVRGMASGLAAFVNWGTLAIVVGFYLEYADAVSQWFAWWSFAILNLAGVVFVAVFIPETKGKSLEEIQRRFESGHMRW